MCRLAITSLSRPFCVSRAHHASMPFLCCRKGETVPPPPVGSFLEAGLQQAAQERLVLLVGPSAYRCVAQCLGNIRWFEALNQANRGVRRGSPTFTAVNIARNHGEKWPTVYIIADFDLDHVIPVRRGGPTCRVNLSTERRTGAMLYCPAMYPSDSVILKTHPGFPMVRPADLPGLKAGVFSPLWTAQRATPRLAETFHPTGRASSQISDSKCVTRGYRRAGGCRDSANIQYLITGIGRTPRFLGLQLIQLLHNRDTPSSCRHGGHRVSRVV